MLGGTGAVADLEGTSHAFVALERDMKYHLTTHTDNNRTKFSIIETIKNARNKKRERRYREIFCLETACILMEASYQAYFPLPTTFSLRWNSNDLDHIKSTSITMDKSGQTVRKETTDYNSLSKSNRIAEEISVCEMQLPVPVPVTSETSQQKQKSGMFSLPLPSQSSSSSSFSSSSSSSFMEAAESGVGVGAGRESVLPALSASPRHTADGATALEVSDVYVPAAITSTPKSTVSTVSRTGEDTVASAVISSSPHPIPRITSLRQDRHTTDHLLDSMHTTLSEIPGLPKINDTVLPGSVRGQDPANESATATDTAAVAAAAVTMSSTIDADSVRTPTGPQQSLSSPHPHPHSLPSADVPTHEALDDNRVFGPKMDLPRMGLKLLSSFENKEHATFGFVATTPRPASFHPLEGEEHFLKYFYYKNILSVFSSCTHDVL